MAKCPHCGAHVGEYAYTCIKCGNILTNGSDKEFEIKRTVSVPTPGASRRRRRPGMNANAENKSNIEAIRAMLIGANEEKSETEPVIENAPVIEEPVVIKEEPVFVEPIVEEAPVIEEPIFVEPIVEEIPVIEEPVIIEEAPVIEEPIVEETPVFTEPATEEKVEPTSLFTSSYARRRHRRLLNSEESASRIDAIKQMMVSEEKKEEAPVIEEPVVIEEEPVFVEPIIEEAPVIEEPVVIEEEPAFVEPIIEEAPVIEEPVVIEEEPVFVEPVIEEIPVIEEPVFVEPVIEEVSVIEKPVVIEEEPVFVEPVIEEVPVIEESVVVEEEPVFVEPVIEEVPVTEEPVVIEEEPVFVEPIIEETPVIEEPVVIEEEPVFVEPIVEEVPVIEEPVVIEEKPIFVEPVIEEAPVIEEPVVIEEEPVFVEPVIEEVPVIEEPVIEEAPVIEEPVVIEEEPAFVEPIIEETPVIEEPVVIEEEPAFVEPIIEETPVIEESVVIEEEPVFVEPTIEETPVIEEPVVIEEEPAFVEPVIEEVPVIEEPVVIEEEPIFVEPIIEETPVIEEPVVIEEEPVSNEVVEEKMEPAEFSSSYSRRRRRMANAAESASRIEAIKQMMASNETVEEKKEEVIENTSFEEPVTLETPATEESVTKEPEAVIEEPVMEDLYSDKKEENLEATLNFKDLESDSNGKVDILESLKAEKKENTYTYNNTSYNKDAETQRVNVNYGGNYSSGNQNSYNNHADDETFNKIFGTEEKKKPEVKKNPAVLAAVISVAVIAVVVALIIIISGIGGARNPANILYQKDNVIYSANLGTGKSEVITENAKIGSYESMSIAENATYINADGSMMIYTEKTEADNDGFALYMKEADAPKGTASLIDGDISYYRISENFDRIVYLKNSEGAFCIRDMEDGGTETVATNVKLFFTNKTCDRFVYLLENGVLYMKDNRSTPIKLSDNADIDFIDEELNKLYYKENGDLYLYSWLGEKELIASGVYNLRAVTEEGEVYYISETEETYCLYDFINDEKKKDDEKVTEAPEKPKEPTLFPELDELNGNLSREEYIALIVLFELGMLGEEEMVFLEEYYAERMIEYEQSLIEYEKALAEYEKVEARNALRAELKETSFTKTYYTLYFFDGSESKVISTRALKGADEGEYIDDYITAPLKKALIEYSDYDAPSGKIKLSEINSADEVNERVEEFFPRLANLKIAIKDKDAKLDYNPWIFHTYISEDMEFIYVLGNSSYGEAGNLYKIAVGQESLGEMQKIETDLSYENFSLQGNDLIYLKNSGLYINRHKVADIKRGTFAGTSYNGYDYLKDLQLLYYINENDEFVVKDLAEGSEKIIDKGVFCFRTFEGGEFFYIKKDANNKDCIYTIINDKIALIADGVDWFEMIGNEKDKSLLRNINGALVDFRPVGGYL